MWVGGVMAGLGVIIGLITAISSATDTHPTPSPFDQIDELIEPEVGFIPLIVPTLRAVIDLRDQLPSASQPLTGQDLAASILALTGILPTAPIWFPDRLVIPAIELEAPVVLATLKDIQYQGKLYQQWVAPDSFAAGRLITSDSLGVFGNMVLIGHHNIYGEVFAHLVDLEVNDVIVLYSGERKYAYLVALKMILPERYQPLSVRLQNARWLLTSSDERLTLITCWPYTDNTHRLIIVATPVSLDEIANDVVTPRLTPLPLLDWKSIPSLTLPPPEATVEASPLPATETPPDPGATPSS